MANFYHKAKQNAIGALINSLSIYIIPLLAEPGAPAEVYPE
jgi:hypothetical protein